MFFVSHLNHAYVIADLIVIPIQYGLIGHVSLVPVWKSGIDSAFVAYLLLIVAFGLLAVPAFRRLAHVTLQSMIPRQSRSGSFGKLF
jgi:hypothetical protein